MMDLQKLLFGRSDLSASIDPSVHSVSLVDVRRDDCPLIYVNRGFAMLTGYAPGEVVGRNCRFLQGAATDAETVRQMRQAIVEGLPFLADLTNYKKDGKPFWNRLSLRPVRDLRGAVTHYVGIQTDITAMKRVEEKVYDFALELAALPSSKSSSPP